MIKRIISGVLCACMACTAMAVTAFAKDYTAEDMPTGWGNSFLSYADGVTDPLGVELVTNKDIVPSGEAALHIYATKDQDNYSANARQNISALKDGSKYLLTGKLNTDRDTWRLRFMIGSRGIRLGDGTQEDGTRCQVGRMVGGSDNFNKWVDISQEFLYDATYHGNSKDFKIQVAGKGNIYADDLAVREILYADDGETVVGYGENLLVNGDFEADFVKPEEASYISVASRNAANYIAVKTIHNVEIRVVNADGTTTKLDTSTTAAAWDKYQIKVYKHDGLTNNKPYTYIVKTVGTNGMASDGVTVSGTPSEAYDNYININQWSYKNNNATYGTVAILKGEGRNGSAGMKLSNMSDSSNGNVNVYITNRNSITLEKNKIYKLSFWAKADVANATPSSMNIKMSKSYGSKDGAAFGTSMNNSIGVWDIGTDWSEQTCYFKAGDVANNMEIVLNRHFENLVLDDFSLCEVNSDLTPVEGALNLLADKNGDFETFESGLFDTSYKFYPAYPDDEQFGEIMDPNGITALAELADYDTDVLYAEAAVTNQVYDNGKDYVFFIAIYKDGALYDVRLLESQAAYLPFANEGEKVGAAYRLPSDFATGDYTVKTFIIDSLSNINPLGAYGVIE